MRYDPENFDDKVEHEHNQYYQGSEAIVSVWVPKNCGRKDCKQVKISDCECKDNPE